MNKEKNIVIAIDGPAASGKGTLARKLAEHLGIRYLDTGSLYRAVAYQVLTTGGRPEDIAQRLTEEDLTSPILRSEAVGNKASAISTIAAVRENLLQWQRDFAAGGAVLDGRDIGTVVCPDATIKFFVFADVKTRAKRRYAELKEKGIEAELSVIKKDIALRDERDRNRKTAPLLPAEDAIQIDTSSLSVEEVFDLALSHIKDVR